MSSSVEDMLAELNTPDTPDGWGVAVGGQDGLVVFEPCIDEAHARRARDQWVGTWWAKRAHIVCTRTTFFAPLDPDAPVPYALTDLGTDL